MRLGHGERPRCDAGWQRDSWLLEGGNGGYVVVFGGCCPVMLQRRSCSWFERRMAHDPMMMHGQRRTEEGQQPSTATASAHSRRWPSAQCPVPSSLPVAVLRRIEGRLRWSVSLPVIPLLALVLPRTRFVRRSL